MMPYAFTGTISKGPLEDGIEISDAQYREAIAAKIAGKDALVLDGALVIRDPAPSPDHTWQDGQWVAPPDPGPAPEPELDPLEQTLTKRQINAALIEGADATDPDGTVEAAIGAIEDAKQRALALNDWRHAPYYARDHQLFQDADLLTAMAMTPDQVDDLWRLGVTLPA